jgi:hemerythrin-like metal-binding protein
MKNTSKRSASNSRARPEIFTWSGKYRVGIAKVDQQHKKLVALINALARQHTECADPAVLAKVLDELASYTNYHFKAEESLMRQYGVDADFQAGHQKAHAGFVQEVARASKLARENPQGISTRTLTFLSRWLIQHILGTDMRMANEIIALEKGLDPHQARDSADSKIADSNEVLLGALGELYESLAVRTQEFLRANHQLKNELASLQGSEAPRAANQDLALLNRSTELLQNCLSSQEAYRAVSHMGNLLALGAHGALLVCDEAGTGLSTVATWGAGTPALPTAFTSDCCWAMRHGRAHEVIDPQRDLICNHFGQAPATAYLCLPLLLRGKLLGLLHVDAGTAGAGPAWQRLVQVATAMGNAVKPVLAKLLAMADDARRDTAGRQPS